MGLFEQCIDGLVALEATGEPGINQRVDHLVDRYLAGFGYQTAAMRLALEKAYVARAPMTRMRDLIRSRIMREDGKRGAS
jgi:hypothetical protein